MFIFVGDGDLLSMRDEGNDDPLTEMLFFDGESRVDDSVDFVFPKEANSDRFRTATWREGGRLKSLTESRATLDKAQRQLPRGLSELFSVEIETRRVSSASSRCLEQKGTRSSPID